MEIIKKALDTNFIKYWMEKGFNPIILSILNRRTLTDEENILNIFLPLLENIASPFLFKNINKAFQIIDDTIAEKKKIIIFGDRDVDGITSTVIIYDFLKNLKADVHFEVPTLDDPYGIDIKKAAEWKEKNYSLCIAVDCGTTNTAEIEMLNQNNIKTIIIDHHQPPENLPDACIINPNCEKNFIKENFAACGVVFLFIFGYLFFKSNFYSKKIAVIYSENDENKINIYQNLILINDDKLSEDYNFDELDFIYMYENDEINPENKNAILKKINGSVKSLQPISNSIESNELKNFKDIKFKIHLSINYEIFSKISNLNYIKEKYLPLVMLGTIADMMSLTKTNRIFVKHGLKIFKKGKHKNLKSLCDELQIDLDELNAKDIAWNICPVLNAPGRMGVTALAVDFLLDENNSKELLNEIIQINENRKKKGNYVYNNYFNKIDSNKEAYSNNLAFFYGDDIEAGITGITAAKLSKASGMPVIVAAKQGECYTGSIRGETNYHFVDFLNKASEIFIQFGGHKQAAGFRFHENDLENFKDFLSKNSNLISNAQTNKEILIDAEIPQKFLEYNLFSILNVLEPFGIDNPPPIFYTSGIKILNYTKMGKEKQHLKLFFDAPDYPFVGVFWSKADWFCEMHRSDNYYDVIYELETNRYNNQILLQMNIIEMQISPKK